MTEKFYSVTAEKNINSIKENGLNPYSYWISNQHSSYEDILDYYIGTVEDDGENPVTLVVERSKLDKNKMEPDSPGIAEPITSALEMDEDEVIEEWEKCKGTAQDSIDIIGTLRYRERIPSEILMIEMNDELIPLLEHISTKPTF